jgi:hypothetical protein
VARSPLPTVMKIQLSTSDMQQAPDLHLWTLSGERDGV